MAIDCTICEGSRSMKAHVGTFMEAKLSLMAKHEAMVGQSWVRLLIFALCFTSICIVPLTIYRGTRWQSPLRLLS